MTVLSPERLRHDRIERAADTVPDSDGHIGHPWRVESMLERLERSGQVSHRERLAGDEFGRQFRLAHLDPLKAADLLRGHPGGETGPHGSEAARRRVNAALDALGGIDSPCGSAAWHVLGHELSIRQWAMRRGLRHDAANGILRGALGVLASHFGM